MGSYPGFGSWESGLGAVIQDRDLWSDYHNQLFGLDGPERRKESRDETLAVVVVIINNAAREERGLCMIYPEDTRYQEDKKKRKELGACWR